MLDRHGLRATFYVLPARVRPRTDEWREVAASGHEIGCHTSTHPCSSNFAFARHNALEDYDLTRIEREIDRASERIEGLVGVRPTTFAYPCGQSFVGRGEKRVSYVPSVARRFVAGRGFHGRVANDPRRCDLAHLDAFSMDGIGPGEAAGLVEGEPVSGRWVIVGGHQIGDRAESLTVGLDTLEWLCRRAAAGDLWVAPVDEVARHVAAAATHRPTPPRP